MTDDQVALRADLYTFGPANFDAQTFSNAFAQAVGMIGVPCASSPEGIAEIAAKNDNEHSYVRVSFEIIKINKLKVEADIGN